MTDRQDKVDFLVRVDVNPEKRRRDVLVNVACDAIGGCPSEPVSERRINRSVGV